MASAEVYYVAEKPKLDSGLDCLFFLTDIPSTPSLHPISFCLKRTIWRNPLCAQCSQLFLLQAKKTKKQNNEKKHRKTRVNIGSNFESTILFELPALHNK